MNIVNNDLGFFIFCMIIAKCKTSDFNDTEIRPLPISEKPEDYLSFCREFDGKVPAIPPQDNWYGINKKKEMFLYENNSWKLHNLKTGVTST